MAREDNVHAQFNINTVQSQGPEAHAFQQIELNTLFHVKLKTLNHE